MEAGSTFCLRILFYFFGLLDTKFELKVFLSAKEVITNALELVKWRHGADLKYLLLNKAE